MRSRMTILFAALFFALPGAALADDLGPMQLSLVQGDVQVLIKDSTDWTDAAVNVPLGEGDRLWVPDGGRAEVRVRGNAFIRSDGNTALDILSATDDAVQFYLDQGHIYVNNRRGGIGTVQVDTPLASVRSYDNSITMIDVDEDGVTQVSVLKGYAVAESRSGATRVSAGDALTIRGESEADVAPIGPPDDWEQWNTSRDQAVSAWGENARYLPDELQEYASELDGNGSWDYEPDYGYVWFPTVVAAGWAPYTVGQWVWINTGYVWISAEPWGWAPFHYGRWVYIAARGWCWVPPGAGAVYWGPGYVGWIVTPTYVAWVPLAPGEMYYGYGNYGPWSANISTVNVTNVFVNRTYVNARHERAVTVVKRDTFGTGVREHYRTVGNPFLERRHDRDRDIGIVPPRARPDRRIVLRPSEGGPREHERPPAAEEHRQTPPRREGTTPPASPGFHIGVPRENPPPSFQPPVRNVQPPDRVKRTRPQEIRTERPLVRERSGSVFRPSVPQNLPVKRSKEPKVIIRGHEKRPGAVQKGGEQRKEREVKEGQGR
jgi:hypothetical protein